METIKQSEHPGRIVILTTGKKKQSLPFHVILWLALGTLAGLAAIFGLFMGANYFGHI
jgi:hypothetical protein